jgi:hypothetical protein
LVPISSEGEDIGPLLLAGIRFKDDDALLAFERVWRGVVARIRVDAWKLTRIAIEEKRQQKYPDLLREL